MDYRELINEAQELMGEAGRTKKRRGAQKKEPTPAEKKARAIQSKNDKAKNNATKKASTYGTMNTERPGEETAEPTAEPTAPPKEEKKVSDKVPKIPKADEETNKKYVLDYSQPLEAIVMMFRAVYDKGAMPGGIEAKNFFLKMNKLMVTKESVNEKHMKKEAKKFYKKNIDIDPVTKKPADKQEVLNTAMAELVTFATENAHEKTIKYLEGKIKDPKIKKIFTARSSNIISAFYANFVTDYKFTTYDELKRKFPDPEDLEAATLAAIYQRFYYIFVMYRFANVIGHVKMIPDINKAKRFFALDKLMSKAKKSATDGKSSGSEANVQNILQQAMTQLLSIDTADIAVMESYIDTVNSANGFMDEGLSDIIGKASDAAHAGINKAGKAVGNAIAKTAKDTVSNNNPRTMRVMGSIPSRFLLKARANKEEITKYPQVVVDFIIFLSFLLRRKAFSSEQFNILVKAKEINTINLMSTWLAKNKEISETHNYIEEAIAFMVDAKENGNDGGASALEKMGARSPNAKLAGKTALGAAKLGLGAAKLLGKGIGKLGR